MRASLTELGPERLGSITHGEKMQQENKLASLQLAKLFLNLAEVERLIQNEILPAMAHLQKMPDDELAQTLELAASNINQTLNTYRLTAGK